MRQFQSLAAAALVALATVPSVGAESLGRWTTEDGKMEYQLELCGDGTQLCGTLVALYDSSDNAENRPYLNKPLVQNLPAAGENVWAGTISILGHTANGTVTMNPGQSVYVEGCLYFVVCKNYTLIPKA